MAHLGRVLVQIVSLASLTAACSDDDDRQCYSDAPLVTYDVPIPGDGTAGAGGADAGAAGASGTGEIRCADYCNPGDGCYATEAADGSLIARCLQQGQARTVTCPPPGVAIGRRPEGVLAPPDAGSTKTTLGAFFAQVAHLEAASIHAFARLRRELRAHGAGERLLARTRAAARDEVRHARQMASLAQRYGARVPRVVLQPFRARSLFELACENEVEGCVRETFGAAAALWQAERAATAELRAVFAEIARDETRHAELACQLRAWFLPQLTEDQREELARLRSAAITALRDELAIEPPAVWREVAGVASAASASHLLALLAARFLTRPYSRPKRDFRSAMNCT